MLHVGDGDFPSDDARKRLLHDARGRRCRGGRFLCRSIDGEESLSGGLDLDPFPFLLRCSFGGQSCSHLGLATVLLFSLFPLFLLLDGSQDGLLLVHHFLEERLTGLLRAATADDGRASIAFFHGHRDGLGHLLRTGSALVALEPDHPLQLDGGVLLDGAGGRLHAYLELVLEELDGLRAALSEVPGQLVDSYLIH
jgi:hypothetical protein